MAVERVAVIGGGIGGLTAAIALRERGIDVEVFEAAEALAEVGAGIWVPPNAMQVLDRLELADAVRRAGVELDHVELRDYRAGVLQTMAVGDMARRYGYTTVGIHRAALHRVLAARVPADRLHLGKAASDVRQDGGRVRVTFADGSHTEAQAVIGADGVRSAVRRRIFPDVPLRYSGQSSYRAVLPFTLPPGLERASWEVWAPGRRFGFSAIGDGQVYWYATLDAPAGQQETPRASWERAQALATDFPAPIPELVSATEPERVIRTDMYDFRPIPSWHRGRVVLLGDAAHATTPNLGQGGAQAMESAWVLAEELWLHDDPAEAFQAYEGVRMAKAKQVVNRSWQLGKLAHLGNPLGRALRNLVIRLTPDAATRRQLDGLYRLNY